MSLKKILAGVALTGALSYNSPSNGQIIDKEDTNSRKISSEQKDGLRFIYKGKTVWETQNPEYYAAGAIALIGASLYLTSPRKSRREISWEEATTLQQEE